MDIGVLLYIIISVCGALAAVRLLANRFGRPAAVQATVVEKNIVEEHKYRMSKGFAGKKTRYTITFQTAEGGTITLDADLFLYSELNEGDSGVLFYRGLSAVKFLK